ncbi:DUF4838 domain-containing protein [Cohnella soli]|uniref:DUF4838 domain-containing protein n=1 Tax=Cohnella soli TaxID=425005 RepID=A0ABW0I691_9BACL
MSKNADLLHRGCVHVIAHDNETILFAAHELVQYLKAITASGWIVQKEEFCNERNEGIWIGLSADLPNAPRFVSGQTDDDAVWIDVSCGKGSISGTNPRSVLMSVYRFLTEIGCRWVRPGVDGEIVPKRDVEHCTVKVQEAAAYKYRGVCIEGAVSVKHVTDMIDWMAKVGFNSYFIQFREAYFFFERWYKHLNNPLKSPSGDFNVETARRFAAAAKREIRKRGMIYQAVGHGWTCTPFGIQGLSWEKWEHEVSSEITRYFAQVDGKRQLWQDIPINTELCYSNVEARGKMIEEIVLYASENPEVDLLHVWLSDGFNNQCECETCVLSAPSDLYVLLMNELDQALTARGLETRIAFLIYHELLWPPKREKIMRPDRFVLQFSPITRTYRQSFETMGSVPAIPPFVRNRVELPLTAEGNVSFLQAWKKDFPGDSFDFDYHYMWAHQRDPGYVHIARIVYEDIRGLNRLGLDGFVSCQVQRSFFPSGLGMNVMARTLWNKELEFGEIAEDYFAAAYGEDGRLVLNYSAELSKLYFDLHLENAAAVRKESALSSVFDEIYSLIREFEPVIGKNARQANRCHDSSWRYLKLHAEIWTEMTRILEQLYKGEDEQSRRMWEDTRAMLWAIEDECHPVLDVYNFVGVWDEFFSLKAL